MDLPPCAAGPFFFGPHSVNAAILIQMKPHSLT